MSDKNNSINYRTIYNYKRDYTKTPSGKRTEQTYRYELGKDGQRKLIKDQEINVYDLIQANKPLSLSELVKRYTETGDASILNVKNGAYGDFTNLPKNTFELLNKTNQLKKQFDNLPVEVKSKYDNDFNKFLDKIINKKPTKKETKKEEPTSKETKIEEPTSKETKSNEQK